MGWTTIDRGKSRTPEEAAQPTAPEELDLFEEELPARDPGERHAAHGRFLLIAAVIFLAALGLGIIPGYRTRARLQARYGELMQSTLELRYSLAQLRRLEIRLEQEDPYLLAHLRRQKLGQKDPGMRRLR